MAILVVDDSLDERLLLRHLLTRAGHPDVVLAATASEAFDLLGVDGPEVDASAFDLILMDVMMPEVDGIEACRRIKARPWLEHIPIVMVTAVGESEGLEAAFEAGAIDYVTKPLDKVALLARARSALKLKRETDMRMAREAELVELARQLRAANQRLEHLSSHDGLTGVPNRRSFDGSLALEWRRTARDGAPLSLVMIDIDYFKLFNDSYGHPSGDACLKLVADALVRTVGRASDFIARVGGEEFAVILPDTDAEGAVMVAEKLRAAVEALGIAHGSSAIGDVVTISLGVATSIPAPGSSAAALVDAADRALYGAKHAGRNRVRASE